MWLEKINIVGFRGINQITLMLDKVNVLIGENQWGRSSLLQTLSLFLSPKKGSYQFNQFDFYRTEYQHHRENAVSLIELTFKRSSERFPISNVLQAAFSHDTMIPEPEQRIYYQIVGNKKGQDITTIHRFVDSQRQVILYRDDEVEQLIDEIRSICPVLLLSDTKIYLEKNHVSQQMMSDDVVLKQAEQILHYFTEQQIDISSPQLQKSVGVIRALLANYLIVPPQQPHASLASPEPLDQSYWLALDRFNSMLVKLSHRDHEKSRQWRLALLGLFISLIYSQGVLALSEKSRPILLIDDPGSRFHPIMLAVVWDFFDNLPLQKITTTNSSELLSFVSINNICRMVRTPSKIATFQTLPQLFNRLDLRRIYHHIQLNRASTLFARAWLFVEGETEIWLLNELAHQCGYHLESEGVKIIEFAQCGIKPLLKLAQSMGISWHAIVDGDEAGRKYAQIITSFVHHHQEGEDINGYLTLLPALDIETFMFKEGFSEVFYEIASISPDIPLSTRKVIHKAIKRTSKPDLAIAIAERAELLGDESIPLLLRHLLARVVKLARQGVN